MSTTKAFIQAARTSLSVARLGTYEAATGASGDSDPSALALYAWNAQVSAAFLAPLHICEVVIRNAAAEALESIYGPRWPWEQTFVLSLPDNHGVRYSPRRDLTGVAARQPSTGKVIPELKFVFWQQLFTHRHDVRMWDSHLLRVFPGHPHGSTTVHLRNRIFQDLDKLRNLRNRIAHHEPIFARNLCADFERIVELVSLRSALMASWMVANQDASPLLASHPIFRGGSLWTPQHEEIAKVAYQIWRSRGNRSDREVEDWLAAKKHLGLAI